MNATTPQPKDAESGRFICTKKQPMRPMRYGNSCERWMHPDAKDRGIDDPNFDHFICPHCHLVFKVEVAE